MLGEDVTVRVHIHTGNNRVEYVYDVQAMLILPEGVELVYGVNPVFIGQMPPMGEKGGPADAFCNWTVVFNQPGIYELLVNVSCVDTQFMPRWLLNSTVVEVYAHPHVEFTVCDKIYVNQTVVFDATNSYSRAVGGWIVSYEWDFGDGTKAVVSLPVVEHGFERVGYYIVALKVTDDRGLSSVMTTELRAVLFGDVNLDGVVNIVDLSFVAFCFGSVPSDERWKSECDLNGDGVVNIVDISLVAREYGLTG
jgi:hypothetical protein